ncbi:hypothetical protein MRX96_057747 [Rhipicephalus microplus]
MPDDSSATTRYGSTTPQQSPSVPGTEGSRNRPFHQIWWNGGTVHSTRSWPPVHDWRGLVHARLVFSPSHRSRLHVVYFEDLLTDAMGRIFVGLCQVGAWGCFGGFNWLEESMLWAVLQQIQMIQETLRSLERGKGTDQPLSVELIGKQVRVNPDMTIFIKMNPGYAGRSNLPGNQKKLFCSLKITSPDRQLIAQVTLFPPGLPHGREDRLQDCALLQVILLLNVLDYHVRSLQLVFESYDFLILGTRSLRLFSLIRCL